MKERRDEVHESKANHKSEPLNKAGNVPSWARLVDNFKKTNVEDRSGTESSQKNKMQRFISFGLAISVEGKDNDNASRGHESKDGAEDPENRLGSFHWLPLSRNVAILKFRLDDLLKASLVDLHRENEGNEQLVGENGNEDGPDAGAWLDANGNTVKDGVAAEGEDHYEGVEDSRKDGSIFGNDGREVAYVLDVALSDDSCSSWKKNWLVKLFFGQFFKLN